MFRLAHFSDPHLAPPPGALGPADLFSKRALSRFAWRRKRAQHDPAVLAALVADVAAHAPDHLAVTGDLMNFATDAEAAQARRWLAALGSPREVTFSPGNHDALTRRGHLARIASFRPWFGDGEEGDFPFVRRRGRVAIVNLNTAAPTPLHLATGELGQGQRDRLADALRALEREGAFRVVLLHHPPTPGAVSGRKRLADAEALGAVLAETGADLVLHGHAHEALVGRLAGPRGPIPVLGVPSASSPNGRRHAAARWHALEIADDGGLTVVARGLSPDGDGFVELGRYHLPPAAPG